MTIEKLQSNESVVKHKKVSEEIFLNWIDYFGYSPLLLLCHEVQIMYAKNATSEWSGCKNKEEQSTIINSCYSKKKILGKGKTSQGWK